MPSTAKLSLNRVLFPVEERPIYQKARRTGQLPLIEEDASATFEPIPRFKAIVDIETDHVFAVVVDSYALVPNAVAIDLGRQCFAAVFGNEAATRMELFNIVTPRKRSFCHVDFVHSNGAIYPTANDPWLPFLRITNSYNRTRPLRFDLGFCRGICKNGMVFGGQTISYRYLHTYESMARSAEFRTSFVHWGDLSATFLETLHNLKRYFVPRSLIFPLVCHAFDIRFGAPDLAKKRRGEQLRDLYARIIELADHYCGSLGENGYAALNVLTDFASRPLGYFSPDAVIDSLQKKSGEWIDAFPAAINANSFRWETYLDGCIAQAKMMEGAAAEG